MQFIFMDEGGTSKYEPDTIVAGVFVDGDEQLVPLEERLSELVRRHIPVEDQRGFVFHANDIWSGAKYFRDRERWPRERRWQILLDLAAVPYSLDLGVAWGIAPKAHILAKDRDLDGKDQAYLDVHFHTLAFVGATMMAEEYMGKLFANEIAQIVAEDEPKAREMVKGVHAHLRHTDAEEYDADVAGILPLKHIRGSIHFASKSESAPLQVADICAFLLRGRMKRQKGIEPFYEHLRGALFARPADELHPDDTTPPWPYGPLPYDWLNERPRAANEDEDTHTG